MMTFFFSMHDTANKSHPKDIAPL